jgi:hypothetical protein
MWHVYTRPTSASDFLMINLGYIGSANCSKNRFRVRSIRGLSKMLGWSEIKMTSIRKIEIQGQKFENWDFYGFFKDFFIQVSRFLFEF